MYTQVTIKAHGSLVLQMQIEFIYTYILIQNCYDFLKNSKFAVIC